MIVWTRSRVPSSLIIQQSEIWIESILASHSVLVSSHPLRLHGHEKKNEQKLQNRKLSKGSSGFAAQARHIIKPVVDTMVSHAVSKPEIKRQTTCAAKGAKFH